jgi:hypothetical protein
MTLAIDGMGSHYPVLAAMVGATKGPVLELGLGDFSTPLLHMLCGAQRPERKLVSIENSSLWLSKFLELRRAWHVVGCVPVDDLTMQALIDAVVQWSVAFVDFAPGEHRARFIAHHRENVDFFVVHDAEDSPVANYGFTKLFKTFKYAWKWGKCNVDTAVLSDKYPIPLEGL